MSILSILVLGTVISRCASQKFITGNIAAAGLKVESASLRVQLSPRPDGRPAEFMSGSPQSSVGRQSSRAPSAARRANHAEPKNKPPAPSSDQQDHAAVSARPTLTGSSTVTSCGAEGEFHQLPAHGTSRRTAANTDVGDDHLLRESRLTVHLQTTNTHAEHTNLLCRTPAFLITHGGNALALPAPAPCAGTFVSIRQPNYIWVAYKLR